METLVLEVEKREQVGTGSARRSRRAGRMPAVVYAAGEESVLISVDSHDFDRRIAHLEGTHLVELRSSDAALNARMVLVREVQIHPSSGIPLHADFHAVRLDQAIEVHIPLHFEGKAAGVTLGGILQPIMREITALCLPTRIPDAIHVDVSRLQIHDSLHVSDLGAPEGVEFAVDGAEPVVSVIPPVVEKKPEVEEAAEGAEAAAAAATPAAAPAAATTPST
jgi:large subunit ribosomal protein L25